MIKHFQHKGLKRFYEKGSHSGIQYIHVKRIQLILTRLDSCIAPEDMNLPGLFLHKLTGKFKGFYSVSVQANWRVIFRFDGQNVFDVDYLDYH